MRLHCASVQLLTQFLSTCTCSAPVLPCTAGAAAKKVYGLNSADAVFRETRDKFYVGARKWLNETLRWVDGRGEGRAWQGRLPV